MDEATKSRIAQQVREERKRRRLSQRELAAMAGVSTNTVGSMERRKSWPQRDNVIAIGGLLGISLEGGNGVASKDDGEREPTVEDSGWSPDVRVALNVIGLYLESFSPEDREERIANIVRAIMARRL